MEYFLLAREGWSISDHHFTELLRSRWPRLELKPASSPNGFRSIDFQVGMADSTIEGSLGNQGSAIICHGELRTVAELALWFGAALPAEAKPLTLFDEGYNHSIELGERTTSEDILRAFGHEPVS